MLGDMALDKTTPNFCLEIKDPWKRAAFIKTVNEIQFYEAHVDIFLRTAVHPHHVKIDLSKDGTMLKYQKDVLGYYLFSQSYQTRHIRMSQSHHCCCCDHACAFYLRT